MSVRPGETRLALRGRAAPTVIQTRFLGANAHASLSGGRPLPGRVHDFRGSVPRRWRRNVPTYAQARCRALYPGIDALYYGNGQRLEYDLVVQPGAAPEQVRMQVTGAGRLDLDAQGDLRIWTAAGELRQERPVAYQEVDGRRRAVDARYVLDGDRLAFAVAPYDRTRPLVIDPVLNYSAYLGGAGDDFGNALVVDGSGNTYVTGTTTSADFPTANAADPQSSGSGDAFVAKLDPTGTQLLYATYLGGSGEDSGQAIALDSLGGVAITGSTTSADFPASGGQVTAGGNGDAFVTRLTPAGALAYSTYLGGTGEDAGNGVAVGGNGNVYVAGMTASVDFPGAAPNDLGDFGDAFVAKLQPGGTALAYSRYLGGGDFDAAYGLVLLPSGEVLITGTTYSADFPKTNAFQKNLKGVSDAFVTRLEASGQSLVYSTFLGGNDLEDGLAIQSDEDGGAWLTGATASVDFPTASPLQAALRGGSDAFVAHLNAAGTALTYASYLGGASYETGYGLATDGANGVWVAGETWSADFPTAGAVQPAFGGGFLDAFLTHVTPGAPAYPFSTYLGGSGGESVAGLAVDGQGNAYLTGATSSADFPTAASASSSLRGLVDAFVVRIGTGAGAPSAPSGLQATAGLTAIALTWQDTGGNAAGYRIERKTGAGSFSHLTNVSTAGYLDPAIAPSMRYTYRVRAFNNLGNSAYSNTASALSPSSPPTAPTSLTATIVSSSRIDLAWIDTSEEESGFRIERQSGTGTFTLLGQAGESVTAYSDLTATTGVSYTYRVVATNASGDSGPATAGPVLIPAAAKAKISPAKANFGNVRVAKAKTLKIKVTNAGKVNLYGTVGTLSGTFRVIAGAGAFNLTPKKSVTVLVQCLASAAGTYTGQLTITTTDPARATVQVPLSAKAK